MKKLEINGKNYSIPTKWEELKLKDYKAIIDLSETLMEQNEEEEYTELQKSMKIYGIILNESDIFFYKLPVRIYNEITEALSFLATPYEGKEYEKNVIRIGEKDFYINTDLDKMTMGTQISYQLYIQKLPKQRIIDMITPAMATFLSTDKSFKKEFDADEYIETIKYLDEHLNYTDGINVTTFFFFGLIK